MPDMPIMSDDAKPSPFQPAPGANPPLLAGRHAEMASIEDACARVVRGSAPVPMAFLGLRGLGKTVLLNEIRNRTRDGLHLAIEVETGVPLSRSMRAAIISLRASLQPIHQRFGKAFMEALRCLPMPTYDLPHNAGALTLTVPNEEEQAPEQLPLGQALNVLNEAAAKAHKYVVVTVDEVQDVDVAGLRSLVARVHQSGGTAAPILFACAGLPETRQVLKSLRTYAKRWDRFELGFLSRAETAEAIRVPIEKAGASITDRALDLVAEEAAGYPFFIQRYASAAWNEHHGKTITLEDAQAAIPKVRAMVDSLFYAEDLNDLSPRERLFCRTLAELGEGAHELGEVSQVLGVQSSGISSIRSNLIAKGVMFVPSSGTVQFRIPLTDRYIREHPDVFYDADVKKYERALRPLSADTIKSPKLRL